MPNFHGGTYNKQAHAESINKTRNPLDFKKLLPALYYDGARHDTHIFGCGSCDVLTSVSCSSITFPKGGQADEEDIHVLGCCHPG
jgi:hypothetical protein